MDVIIVTGLSSTFFQRALGAYQLAHHLRTQGYSVQVIDFTNRFTAQELYATILSFVTDNTLAVGVSTTFLSRLTGTDYRENVIRFLPSMPLNLEEVMLRLGESHPKIKRVAGGAYSSVYYGNPVFDVIVDGYGEDSMTELLRTFRQGGSIGLLPKNKGTPTIERENKNFQIKNLDHSWHASDCLLPHESLPIEISRGCIFRCSFCAFPLNGKKKNDHLRDVQLIADEMRENYRKFGTTRYIISDDTFNDSTEKLRALHAEITALPFKIQFYAYIRIDLLHAHREQIQLLKEMGLIAVHFGVETFHPVAAKAIGKAMPAQKIKDFLYELRDIHWGKEVKIFASMIIGLPGEPVAHIKESMDWWQHSGFPHVFIALSFSKEWRWKSEFAKHPEKYGYKFDSAGRWYSDIMNEKQAYILHHRGTKSILTTHAPVDAFTALTARNHYPDEQVDALTWAWMADHGVEIEQQKNDKIDQYKKLLKARALNEIPPSPTIL